MTATTQTTTDPAMDSARRIDEHNARMGFTRESAVDALLDARAHACHDCGVTMDRHHDRDRMWIACAVVVG